MLLCFAPFVFYVYVFSCVLSFCVLCPFLALFAFPLFVLFCNICASFLLLFASFCALLPPFATVCLLLPLLASFCSILCLFRLCAPFVSPFVHPFVPVCPSAFWPFSFVGFLGLALAAVLAIIRPVFRPALRCTMSRLDAVCMKLIPDALFRTCAPARTVITGAVSTQSVCLKQGTATFVDLWAYVRHPNCCEMGRLSGRLVPPATGLALLHTAVTPALVSACIHCERSVDPSVTQLSTPLLMTTKSVIHHSPMNHSARQHHMAKLSCNQQVRNLSDSGVLRANTFRLGIGPRHEAWCTPRHVFVKPHLFQQDFRSGHKAFIVSLRRCFVKPASRQTCATAVLLAGIRCSSTCRNGSP